MKAKEELIKLEVRRPKLEVKGGLIPGINPKTINFSMINFLCHY